MALDITAAKGAMTGARYIESLKDGRDVWLDGKRVDDVPPLVVDGDDNIQFRTVRISH